MYHSTYSSVLMPVAHTPRFVSYFLYCRIFGALWQLRCECQPEYLAGGCAHVRGRLFARILFVGYSRGCFKLRNNSRSWPVECSFFYRYRLCVAWIRAAQVLSQPCWWLRPRPLVCACC